MNKRTFLSEFIPFFHLASLLHHLMVPLTLSLTQSTHLLYLYETLEKVFEFLSCHFDSVYIN